MKTKVRPSIVGAFVLGAFGLGLIALLSFGSINFLHKRASFVVYFDESIQGLSQGSAVKMSGVTLGRVTDMHVAYNPVAKNRSSVEVVCEFDRNMIVDSQGHTVDVTDPDELRRLVKDGMRAQLTVTGLATGLVVVELGFFDPAVYPADPNLRSPEHPDYPVVPYVISATSEIQNGAEEILTNIKRVDFQKLADSINGLAVELRALVADAHQKLDQVDVHGLSEQWKQAGAAVTTLAGDPQIRRTLADLDSTLTAVRGAVGHLDTQVDANGKNLEVTLAQAQATLKQFDAAATTLQRFIADQSGLGYNTTQALTQLAAAAESVQRLADFIERNPNALVTGRKAPK